MKKIPLSGRYGIGKFALVDDEDFPLLSRHNWFISAIDRCPRARMGRAGMFFISRIILPVSGGNVVDHKDRNRLNNQKSNLREASNGANQYNIGITVRNTSGFKGVVKSGHISDGKATWDAKITRDGKCFFLGTFKNKVHAASAYNIFAKAIFGEFAYLNLIPKKQIPSNAVRRGIQKKMEEKLEAIKGILKG